MHVVSCDPEVMYAYPEHTVTCLKLCATSDTSHSCH